MRQDDQEARFGLASRWLVSLAIVPSGLVRCYDLLSVLCWAMVSWEQVNGPVRVCGLSYRLGVAQAGQSRGLRTIGGHTVGRGGGWGEWRLGLRVVVAHTDAGHGS